MTAVMVINASNAAAACDSEQTSARRRSSMGLYASFSISGDTPSMTYQSARAQPVQSEMKRACAVSRFRMNTTGNVAEVRWGEVNAKSNSDAGSPLVALVAEVVDAIHDRACQQAGDGPGRWRVTRQRSNGQARRLHACPGGTLSDDSRRHLPINIETLRA